MLIKHFSCFYGFVDIFFFYFCFKAIQQNSAEDKDDDEIGYYGWIDSKKKLTLNMIFFCFRCWRKKKFFEKTETDFFSKNNLFFDENDWHISRIYILKKWSKKSVEQLKDATRKYSMKLYYNSKLLKEGWVVRSRRVERKENGQKYFKSCWRKNEKNYNFLHYNQSSSLLLFELFHTQILVPKRNCNK